jgi:hypothetical protein
MSSFRCNTMLLERPLPHLSQWLLVQLSSNDFNE